MLVAGIDFDAGGRIILLDQRRRTIIRHGRQAHAGAAGGFVDARDFHRQVGRIRRRQDKTVFIAGDIVGSRQQVDPPFGQGLQGRLPGGETAHADLDAQHLAEDAHVVGRNTFVIAFANADVERRHIGQAGAQHQLPLAAEPAPGIAIQLEIQVIYAGAAMHQQGFALLRPAGKRQQAA